MLCRFAKGIERYLVTFCAAGRGAAIAAYLLAIAFLLTSSPAYAQQSIEASDKSTTVTTKENLGLSLVTIPRMLLQDCVADTNCEVYLYVRPDSTKDYISNVDFKRDWTAVSEVQLSEFKTKSGIAKKNIALIHARTPEQCAKDEICTWYAFRQTALHAYGDDPYTLKVHRQIETPVKWSYVSRGRDDIQAEIGLRLRQIGQAVPFAVEHVETEREANLFFSTVRDVESAVEAYQKNAKEIHSLSTRDPLDFAHILDRGHYRAFSRVTQGAVRAKNFVVMGDGAEDKVLLSARLMTLFGFRAGLGKFPLTVLNNPPEATMPQEAVPLTTLDLLMLRIFYAPEFNEPLSADLARQRFHEVYMREIFNL
jgi:hypothetical protein